MTMELLDDIASFNDEVTSKVSKYLGLGPILEEAHMHYKDLETGFKLLQEQSHKLNIACHLQKDSLQSKPCSSCIDYKQVIENKNSLLESVLSQLIKLYETEDLKSLNNVIRLLCGDTVTLTPGESPDKKSTSNSSKENSENIVPNIFDESLMEIDGTPTGRTSPIIMSKNKREDKEKKTCITSELDSKKCNDTNWLKPDTTTLLNLSTPISSTKSPRKKAKSKQLRLNPKRVARANVVDISTCSPKQKSNQTFVQNKLIVKREPVDNDDTIMPSPTSDIFKPIFNKSSPTKQSNITEIKLEPQVKITETKENKPNNNITIMDHSINLLQPRLIKFSSSPCKPAVKQEKNTDLDKDINISLDFRQDMEFEVTECDIKCNYSTMDANLSPSKHPLCENINATNIPTQDESISLLHNNVVQRNKDTETNPASQILKRNPTPKKLEPIFKEPTVRKKAEKLVLPGWSCEKCENFYGVLYKDNPEMLAQKMNECSKHRGRNNPARPATPPGYWQPRWDVPDNTEQFNRRNNAD